jgi:hypothetical protein
VNVEPASYEWVYNGRRWRLKPHYALVCRWCLGNFTALRSDAVTGGAKCRKALSRHRKGHRLPGRGRGRGRGRYSDTVARNSQEGKACASSEAPPP